MARFANRPARGAIIRTPLTSTAPTRSTNPNLPIIHRRKPPSVAELQQASTDPSVSLQPKSAKQIARPGASPLGSRSPPPNDLGFGDHRLSAPAGEKESP